MDEPTADELHPPSKQLIQKQDINIKQGKRPRFAQIFIFNVTLKYYKLQSYIFLINRKTYPDKP